MSKYPSPQLFDVQNLAPILVLFSAPIWALNSVVNGEEVNYLDVELHLRAKISFSRFWRGFSEIEIGEMGSEWAK